MNCDALQRRLTALENPAHPPRDLGAHLAVCAACRACQQQLLEVERLVTCIAVPPPSRKEAFLRQFGGLDIREEQPQATVLRFPSRATRTAQDRKLQKIAVSFAMAVALLIFAIGTWIWNTRPQIIAPQQAEAPKSLLASRLDKDGRWKNAKTATERFAVLQEVRVEVERNAAKLAETSSHDDLLQQAQLLKQVVDHIVTNEKMSSPGEHRLIQEMIDGLKQTCAQATKLAVEYPYAARSLMALELVAKDGGERLQGLLTQNG